MMYPSIKRSNIPIIYISTTTASLMGDTEMQSAIKETLLCFLDKKR